jgi:hypothetical protein
VFPNTYQVLASSEQTLELLRQRCLIEVQFAMDRARSRSLRREQYGPSAIFMEPPIGTPAGRCTAFTVIQET